MPRGHQCGSAGRLATGDVPVRKAIAVRTQYRAGQPDTVGHGLVAARPQGRPRAGRPRPSRAVHQRHREADLRHTPSHRRGVTPLRRGADRPAGGGFPQQRAAPGPRRARAAAPGTSRGARRSPPGSTGLPGPCRDADGPSAGPPRGPGRCQPEDDHGGGRTEAPAVWTGTAPSSPRCRGCCATPPESDTALSSRRSPRCSSSTSVVGSARCWGTRVLIRSGPVSGTRRRHPDPRIRMRQVHRQRASSADGPSSQTCREAVA